MIDSTFHHTDRSLIFKPLKNTSLVLGKLALSLTNLSNITKYCLRSNTATTHKAHLLYFPKIHANLILSSLVNVVECVPAPAFASCVTGINTPGILSDWHCSNTVAGIPCPAIALKHLAEWLLHPELCSAAWSGITVIALYYCYNE